MTSTSLPFETDVVEFECNGDPVSIRGKPNEYLFGKISSQASFYERDLLDALSYVDLPAGIIVDVGANIGNHTVFFAKYLNRDVISIEPQDDNYRLLLSNIEANGLTTVTPRMIALGSFSGEVSLGQRIPGNDGTYFIVDDESDSEATEKVKQEALDAVIGTEPVALIKIDTEGTELSVLEGAIQTLRRDKPMIAVEIHNGTMYRALTSLLSPLGYLPQAIFGLSDNYIFTQASHRSGEQAARTLHLRSSRSRYREERSDFDHLEKSISGAISASVKNISGEIGMSSSRIQDEVLAARQATAVDRAAIATVAREIEDLRNEEQRLRSELARLNEDLLIAQTASIEWELQYTRLRRSRALIAARKLRQILHKVHLSSPPPSQPSADTLSARIEKSAKSQVHSRRAFAPIRIERGPAQSLPRIYSDKIRVGIASIPERARGLERVVDSLYGQVDEICVYLNRYEQLPQFLNRPKVRGYLGPDVGDRGKFFFMEGFSGYYLTADDDIDYPPFYVDYTLDALERYDRKVVVGWHGSILKPSFEDYYDPGSRQVLSFRTRRAKDTTVHVLGTGCMAMHTQTMPIEFSDFEFPNVADIHFALIGQENRTPFVVIAHREGWAKPIDVLGETGIWVESMGDTQSEMNTRDKANQLIDSHNGWRLNRPRADLPANRPQFAGTFIGRTDRNHWRKGGILKSAHLMRDMLSGLGIELELVDLETQLNRAVSSADSAAPLTIVYPGDPERPDFAAVHSVIEDHARAGKVVIVNLSYNGRSERVAEMLRRIKAWNDLGSVYAMVFSDQLLRNPELVEISDRIVSLPKSLAVEDVPRSSFEQTSGIFIGDYGKLCNADLFDYPVEEWIDHMRLALPNTPIYAVSQYQPVVEKDLGIQILPYLEGNFDDELSRFRVMVSPFKYCTFEMVPVEMAGMGIPIIYRSMEQSLSEYLGMSSVEVHQPADLNELLPLMYNDKGVWERMSASGYLRAHSLSHRLMAAPLYLRLLSILRAHTSQSDQ